MKELRETPLKKHQRFVEFYDIRDAAKALKEMNGKEINGKPVVIEFSRPGGFTKKFFNAQAQAQHLMNSDYNIPPSPIHHPFRKKPSPYCSSSNKPNPNINTNHHPTMEDLSLAEQDTDVAIPINGNPRRTCKKSQNNNHHQSLVVVSATTKQHQQQVKNKNRLWKGKQAKKFDARFLINGDAMVDSNSKDSRTTVMIKNIPNKYRFSLLLLYFF